MLSSIITRRSLIALAQNKAATRFLHIPRYAQKALNRNIATPKPRQFSTLATKLEEELAFEKAEQTSASLNIPKTCSEFLERNPQWKVNEDTIKEAANVKLTCMKGDEKITVTFSIMPTENMEEDQEDQEENDQDRYSAGMDLTIDVSKPATPEAGALTFFASIDLDGEIQINELEYSKDGTMLKSPSAQSEYARSELYTGPRFFDLDESVQEAFSSYLNERGFNTELSDFIQEYSEWKEQKQYLQWLSNLKGFVAA